VADFFGPPGTNKSTQGDVNEISLGTHIGHTRYEHIAYTSVNNAIITLNTEEDIYHSFTMCGNILHCTTVIYRNNQYKKH